jgi:3-deoxy-D-manno-octulosonic-acid transferase
VRYTHIDDGTDLRSAQVLILDTVGILSSVYGYATWSYIGGGFGVGIHNTLEAATFGLPIAFGPNYHKFKEARDMIALGAACSVTSSAELKAWFEPLRDNDEHLQATGSAAREYTAKNLGATELILKGMGYGTK